MGCFGSSDGASGSRREPAATRPRGNANYLPNPKIEKIIENQFVGEGIKCTPAYECKVSADDLKKWRKEFWATRTQGSKHIWDVLRSAIDASADDAEAIIRASGLNAHAGIMTLVFDEHKFPYRVPIACINEPTRYLPTSVNYEDDVDKPEETVFENLKIRLAGENDYVFDMSNYSLVSDVKVKFLDDTDRSDTDLSHCIMLFGGKVLEDNMPLYRVLNLDSEMVFI
mmetsp:Transcript_4141/g.5048  ORF Transcript_4141/g.5048 Transcript_4141/m.5048 type:complete len:227 (+) Transcript_4141:38-718(+)